MLRSSFALGLSFAFAFAGCNAGDTSGDAAGSATSPGGGASAAAGGDGQNGGAPTGQGSGSGATGAPSGGAVQLTGTPIVATATTGTADTLLGTPVDASFNQVNGTAIFKPRVGPDGAPVHSPQDQIQIGWTQIENTKELQANVSGWGLGQASANASSTTRYMSMRAYQIDYFEDVDVTQLAGTAPPTGVYFVSKIYYGHSYEALFSGDETQFSAAVAANLKAATGSISGKAQETRLSFTNVGRGLNATGGDALFVTSEDDFRNTYSSAGPAVPIYVEYRLIPGTSEPPGTTIAWESPLRATLAIDEIDVFHNGSLLDASDTAWDLRIDCSVDGAVVVSGQPLWSSTSVSAGGSHITDDGSGPQDPNPGSSTGTYGRYAQLPFSAQIPASNGDAIQCTINGSRIDKSTPVSLPNVTFQVNVDDATPVEARAGNYDSGNNLDYQIHYTVTYAGSQ